MKALILAGGRGSRLNEFTKYKNKSMIKLFDKPLIEYNLEHSVEAGVSEIIIVVGYKKEEIMKHFGNEFRGTRIQYILQKEQKGVVNAIECAREKIGNSDFILMLADEILVNAKIKKMVNLFREEDLFAVCGVVFEEEKLSIKKTYSAMVNEKGRIFRLIEKPEFPINKIKGTGHCIFKNGILDYIKKTPISMKRGEKELVDMIQEAIDENRAVKIYNISKGYSNINNEEDLRSSEELLKKNNPRILIMHTQMKFIGGAELLIIELANWLTRRGIKNDIITLSKSKEVEDRLINTNIIIPKNNIDLRPPGFKSIKDILKFIKIFRKELKKIINNYDVVNFHNFPVTWTLFPKRKPCIWMLNEPPNLWSEPNAGLFLKFLNKMRIWADRFIVSNSVGIICVADKFNQKRCFERYKRDSKIVYYGVNYDFFSKGKAAKALKKFDIKNKFIIVQSGMITSVKNQFESVQAVKEIKEKIPNAILILAGEYPDKEYLEKIQRYIKENKLEKNVLFTGNLKREDLRDLYKACDVGLYPVGEQGGWLAPFEHLCSGNPVIVSDKLGAASVIKEFDLGIVTKNYSDAILKIYSNLKKYKRDGGRRKKIIMKNLGWNVFTDKMIKAYKDVWRV